MARPREFDIDEVLEAATAAFWRRGYEATSLADLMAATGLQKGSIYKAFGDKHALFLSALQRYLDQMYARQRDLLVDTASPRQALHSWLDMLIDAAPAEGQSCRGCLAVNTLVELGPHDEEVRAVVGAHFARLRRVLVEVVRRGQDLGEIRRDVDAQGIAHLLMTVVAGLLGGVKGTMSKDEARGLAQTTLQLMA